MDVILCLDLATYKTGFAIFTKENKELTHIKSGTVSIKKNADSQKNVGKRLNFFKKQTRTLLKKYKPNIVVIEDTFVKNQKTAKILNYLHGVILEEIYCFDENTEIVYYKPSTLKSNVTGNAKATKKVVMLRITQLMDKHFKKSIKLTDDNEADAIGLGFTYFKKMGWL